MRQTKPPEPIATTTHASAWNQFVNSEERRSASLIRDAAQRGTLIGLSLSGPGGGQWLIEYSGNGLMLQVAEVTNAGVRWIATTAAINNLIENQLSVRNALEDGLLILEVDQASDFSSSQLTASQTEQFTQQFAKLITEIQRQIQNSLARKSEAVHVG